MKKATFEQIEGYEEEKKELCFISDLINDEKDFTKVGGKLPRGALLIGPNGTGKTVLANAFINRSKLKSVSIDFNKASNNFLLSLYLKRKFREAKRKAPCVLFIDEVDKLIGNNVEGFMETSFEKSRILLTEMNKYQNVKGLFILMTANEYFFIDESITRSGRIDKIIRLGYPNENERLSILKHYLKSVNHDKNINLESVAKTIGGFSGADIELLVNNSVIKAFGDHRDMVTLRDIMEAHNDIVFKDRNKAMKYSDKDLKQLSYHEAGHAVVSLVKDRDSLNHITINKRSSVLGHVKVNSKENHISTVEEIRHQIVTDLAGNAAEKLFLGTSSIGNIGDNMNAKSNVYMLIRECGYKGLEYIKTHGRYPQEEPPSYFNSEYKLQSIEKAENELLNECLFEAETILRNNKELVNEIANKLIEKKSLIKDDIDSIMKKFPTLINVTSSNYNNKEDILYEQHCN